MVLLGKMDPHRLKENPKRNLDCRARECKNCGKLIAVQLKVKVHIANAGLGGTGICHAASATKHLETHCNEARLQSTQSLTNEKKSK